MKPLDHDLHWTDERLIAEQGQINTCLCRHEKGELTDNRHPSNPVSDAVFSCPDCGFCWESTEGVDLEEAQSWWRSGTHPEGPHPLVIIAFEGGRRDR